LRDSAVALRPFSFRKWKTSGIRSSDMIAGQGGEDREREREKEVEKNKERRKEKTTWPTISLLLVRDRTQKTVFVKFVGGGCEGQECPGHHLISKDSGSFRFVRFHSKAMLTNTGPDRTGGALTFQMGPNRAIDRYHLQLSNKMKRATMDQK